MIESFAFRLSKWFVNRRWVEPEDAEVFQYGMETILSNVINLFSFFLIAVIFSSVFDGLVFLAIFIVIRQFTGGYHANSYGVCFLIFFAISLVMFLLLRITPLEWLRPLTFLLTLLGGLMILLFAPAPNPEKEFSEEQLSRTRILCIVLVCSSSATIMTAALSGIALHYTFCASLALLAIGVSLMIPSANAKGGGQIEERR